MDVILKIVKSIEEPSLVIKSVNKTVENKVKEKKEDF